MFFKESHLFTVNSHLMRLNIDYPYPIFSLENYVGMPRNFVIGFNFPVNSPLTIFSEQPGILIFRRYFYVFLHICQ
jgi:hypothetical protein